MVHAKKAELKKAVFEALRLKVENHGFSLQSKTDRLLRKHDGAIDLFQLVCLDGNPGCNIQPHVGIRIERVEDIFHQTSGFERKYQKDTPTIGSSVGILLNEDSRSCQFLLRSMSEVEAVAEKIAAVFRDFALAYFARWNSLEAIDAEFNSEPTRRTPHRGDPWLRCSAGMIVAKLVHRPDYKHLEDVYSEVIAKTDKGFHLGRFQSLLKSLQELES